MKLGALTGQGETAEVTDFVIDHRKVARGSVFGAFRGARFNGEDFIADAVKAGAVAIVAAPEAVVKGAVHIADANPRRAFAKLATRFYGPFPSTIVAVTGTNGKTSTVELVRQVWRMAGFQAASIGTLGITTAQDQVSTGLTTPDVGTFLSNLAGLEREGVTHVAYEASSHGLDQYRAEGPKIAAAAFTNLSRDHLDYHGTMDAYLAAKLRLFTEVLSSDGVAVVWADDAASRRVVDAATARGIRVISVGTQGLDLRLVSRTPTALGQTLEIEAGGAVHKVQLPLIGAYQAANALTAAGLAIATGGDLKETLGHLARVQGVRGRLERAVICQSGAPVYVDYAHTPDALEAAVAALRPHAKGRIILVFGAGGDRDTGKRAEMGAIAVRDADLVIVTDDNPRTEDAAAIRAMVLDGATGATEIGDRRAAIAEAIRLARAEDIVLVAGKGHEQGQIVGDRVLPFDDVSVARECAA
ncbi:MAG TPA: UDP-N-acetylmuramoyl-L-alanyl-D-glutamate--2,6-diaminopimelate ligase [Chakrabartia sp.]|nr:UDP-N-acetylmuramoyl-L-alanyl-D-glutamate--2,6-diaminopimelate ligase [Chakrabartia sp.]